MGFRNEDELCPDRFNFENLETVGVKEREKWNSPRHVKPTSIQSFLGEHATRSKGDVFRTKGARSVVIEIIRGQPPLRFFERKSRVKARFVAEATLYYSGAFLRKLSRNW